MARPAPRTPPRAYATLPLRGNPPYLQGERGHLARLWRGSTVALLAIVTLAAALRLPHLASNPGWDGDEGYNYNIAFNLAHGHHQMFALDFAFVQHPPLFFAVSRTKNGSSL